MAKLRITQKQAIMLENLNKPKVLKITESQYNEILKHEGIGESAVIPQIANAISKVSPDAGKDYKRNVNSETKIKGVFNEASEGLWKEFVNELYGLNESGNNLYEKLIKLMEACGYVENRKLSKSKFNGDKNVAKDVILGGLHKLHECGSAYMAMEEMENQYDRITQSLTQQLTQEPTNQFSDEEKHNEIQRRRALELQRRREAGEIKEDDTNQDYTKDYIQKQLTGAGAPASDEEMSNIMSALNVKSEGDESMGNQNTVVGMDILNYEPFKSLPDERNEQSNNRVTLPSLDMADARVAMRSKKDFTDYQFQGPYKMHNHVGYITQFVKRFNEEPIFTNIQPTGADISNEKFLEWKNRGMQHKADWMNAEREQGRTSGLDEIEVDESTMATSSGQYTSGESFLSPMKNEEKIHEALNALKKKVEEESDETIEEQGIGGVGAYDTPGFAKSKFFGNAGKKGKAPVNKGVTHKKTMIPGGSFVEEGAFDKTQWAGGAFVEFDDCTKLNNNKDAQNGGCSTGSVDGVVKLKKTANNVNAPSKKQGE
jgi:hypothetical protein